MLVHSNSAPGLTSIAIIARHGEASELSQLARYCDTIGVQTLVGGGIAVGLWVVGDEGTVTSTLSQYTAEFGVELALNVDGASLAAPFPWTISRFETPVRLDQLRRRFSTRSAQERCLAALLAKGQLSTKDRIREFRYVVRPWLTESGKRTTCLTGHCIVQFDGKTESVDFTFADELESAHRSAVSGTSDRGGGSS